MSNSQQTNVSNPALALFAASFASLFFELLIIRWLSCDFIAFSVFKTFPLVTCFVGLGTGVAKGESRHFRYVGLALLVTVLVTVITDFKGYGPEFFPSLTLYQWNELGIGAGQELIMRVIRMTLLMILLLMGPFAVMFTIGTLIGEMFNRLDPLRAYCVDIAGAITGSLTFALLSFAAITPNAEVAVFAAIVTVLVFITRQPKVVTLSTLLVSCIISLLPVFNNPTTIWSPYYRIDVDQINVPAPLTKSGKNEDVGVYISAHRGFCQAFTKLEKLELSEAGENEKASKLLAGFLDVRRAYYGLPYIFQPQPKDVLILGAGSGSDVREAVRRGATWIDAVEIDPGILSLAAKHNPYYKDPAVHYHLEDGRRFLAKTNKKYDLIILACLDSSALAGTGSSLRTDCYIHTAQSYRDIAKLLKPDGIFALSFGASVHGDSDWLRNRIYRTVEAATGYPPAVMSDEKAKVNWPAYYFITGEPIRKKLVEAPIQPESFTRIDMPADVKGLVLNDDWPFLYVRDKVLDIPYLAVLCLIIGLATYVGRSLLFSKKSGSDIQLFLLGSAFILIELQAISRLALNFGATWITSSVVINSVLLMILAANYLILKIKNPISMNVLYGGLIASLLVSYLMPFDLIRSNLANMEMLSHVVVTVITLFPILIAGLIFATAFKTVKHPSRSFAFNILGSVLGGLLEYLSTYVGINNLVLVAIVLYVFSYLASRKGDA